MSDTPTVVAVVGTKTQPGQTHDQLWVYRDDDGGICWMWVEATGGWWPMVTDSETTRDALAPAAQQIADVTGKTIRCVRYKRANVEKEFSAGN